MAIGPISPVGVQALTLPQQGSGPVRIGEEPSFGQLVGDAVLQLDGIQREADVAAMQVASGESADLHTAVLKMEEAGLAFQLALQVRNKVIEAYQEVMRMQV